MGEKKDMKQAKLVFDSLCRALDAQGWRYDKDEKELGIDFKAQGETLPIQLTIKVKPDQDIILLLSRCPFVIAEDKRVDLAVAVSIINNSIVAGSFDYNVTSGNIFFRLTNSFRDSTIGDDVFVYMISCAFYTIDKYIDKFLMLSKGMLSLEKFIESENN